MNAEVFEDSAVNFCRIKELVKGNEFMWQGTWFRVTKVTEEKIYYTHRSNIGQTKSNSFGAKSQMFVQVAKTKEA